MEDGLWHYLPSTDDALVACGRNKYAVSTAMPIAKHLVNCPNCKAAM